MDTNTDKFDYAEQISKEVREWGERYAPGARASFPVFGEHYRNCPPSEYLKMQNALKQLMLKESVAFGRERDEVTNSALRIYRNIKDVQALELKKLRIPFTRDNWRDIGGFE